MQFPKYISNAIQYEQSKKFGDFEISDISPDKEILIFSWQNQHNGHDFIAKKKTPNLELLHDQQHQQKVFITLFFLMNKNFTKHNTIQKHLS